MTGFIRRGRWIALILLLLAGSVFALFKQTEKEKALTQLIQQGVQFNHFLETRIDDDLSRKAFDLYLKRLDYNKRFLLKMDVDRLNRQRDNLDDLFLKSDYSVVDQASEILNTRIAEARKYYEEILKKPFDFTKNEFVETDPDKLSWVTTKEEMKERWRLALKMQVLSRIHNAMETQQEALEKADTSVKQKTFAELEIEAREKVLKSHENWFNRMDKMDRNDRVAVYLNAILNTIDPHTGYFPPKDKANFDISMSGKLEGIGATLSEKDGYIEVSQIVPGSACWKQGELKVGDLILKVAQGPEEPVDVVDMRLDEAVQLIRGPKGSEVRLTVKKVDGSIKVIPIIRDVVVLEETYARSAILSNPNSKGDIGYIKLPKFYADFNDKEGRNCATDIKNELEKLQKENVKAIVLDLRDNGGGSLQDVVTMAGLFIEKGPVVQVKNRTGSPYILEDKDPAIQYNGPLVIMTNSFSASASEILAAAMQDYKRAIIVGAGTATYGKGTVQRFFELDQMVNDPTIKPLGAIKMTTQKFYRINGGATQLKGVTPDILLPDRMNEIEIGESKLDYPMEWTSIQPAQYSTWQGKLPSVNMLKQKSQQRIGKSEALSVINQNASWLKEQRDKTKWTLNYEQYAKEQTALKEKSKLFETVDKEIDDLLVRLLATDKSHLEKDTTQKASFDAFVTGIKKDHQLNETLAIVGDMQ